MWYIYRTMLKRYWPLLLIVVSLAAIIGMSQYADSAKQRGENSATHTKTAAVAKSENGKGTNDAEKSYQPPIWAKYVAWPESVGTWAVILTLLVIAWQSIETRKAADAANEATDLARVMQKKERAGFSIDRIIPPEEKDPWGSREPGSPEIVITNQGPTYAFEVECQCAYFASRERVLTKIPRLYSELVPTTFKSGDQYTIHWEYGPVSVEDDLPDDGSDPIEDEKAFLHIYVIVSYRDVFGKLPDSVLHLLWKVDWESIETGDEEHPYQDNNYSKWVRAEPIQ